jgi:hypothetical protein
VRTHLDAVLRPVVWLSCFLPGYLLAQERAPAPANRAILPPVLLDELQASVSAEFLDQLAGQSCERRQNVRDTILGVPLYGQANTRGATRLVLVPDGRQGVFDMLLTGEAQSTTTSYRDPIRVHCTSVTKFSARKRFILDDRGVTSLPARCNAKTVSTLKGVSTDLPRVRGRLARRIGWQRASERRAVSDQVAARHAERDIAQALDEEAAPLVKQINAVLSSDLLRGRGDGRPRRRLRFQTTNDRLFVATDSDGAPATPISHPSATAAVSLHWPTAKIDVATAIAAMGLLRGDRSEGSIEAIVRNMLPPSSNPVAPQRGTIELPTLVPQFSFDQGGWWSPFDRQRNPFRRHCPRIIRVSVSVRAALTPAAES